MDQALAVPTVTAFAWDNLPPEGAPGAPVERRAVPGAGATLRQVRIRAGERAARHAHDHEQFLLVVEGTGRLACAAGALALRPGVVLRLDAHAWHEAVFETDTVLVEVNLAA